LLSDQLSRYGAEHPVPCYTSVALANDLGYLHRVNEGISLTRAASKCLEATLGHDNSRTALAYNVLGSLFFQRDSYVDAAVAWQEYLSRIASKLSDTNDRIVATRVNIANAQQYSGHPELAEKLLAQTLESVEAIRSQTDGAVQNLRYKLADVRLDQHSTRGVRDLLQGLDPEALNDVQIEPDWDGRLAYQRGRLALETGDAAGAIKSLRESARIFALKNPDGRISAESAAPLIASAEKLLKKSH
jgi:hypothetical protein